MPSFLPEEYGQLLIGYRPNPPSGESTDDDPSTFNVAASTYSRPRAFIAHSDESLVWYDYDKWKKCDPGEDVMAKVWKRVKKV